MLEKPHNHSSHETPANILIGVDLGSRHIRLGAVAPDGKLLAFRREPYPDDLEGAVGSQLLTHRLFTVVRQMIDEQATKAPVTALGLGFPGLVQQSTQRIVQLLHAPDLTTANLHQEFTRAFGLPVHFENNANAAAYAEMCGGVARGVSDWLYLHIGSGVGAGLVLDGKLRRGKSGFAGEIGHMNINPEGLECACGSIGCLETMVSTPNIVRRTRERLKRDSTSSLSRLGAMGGFTYDDILTAAHTGDDLARMMLQRTGAYLGMAVANVINLLNLSLVVIGGAPAARPFLVPAIIAEARERAFAPAFADCQIVAAELGGEAGVIGAALLAAQMR